jgi:glutamyl-tRNA synthetase
MHVGNARAALYNYLYARHTGGQFLLRIEDTDAERSTPENVSFILEALAWLGLTPDEDIVYQSENALHHDVLLAQLLDQGSAYHSQATKEDVDAYKALHGSECGFRGNEEDFGAVRLHVPDEGVTTVHDLIRGDAVFENSRLDDPVIARADGSPLYNFAVAVDDADAGITHVIRGEDHLSNTARQLLVASALGFAVPTYAHLPLLHGADGKKLAKRHGSVSVQEFAAAGFLPEALINYLALLGWGPDDNATFLTVDELIAQFDVADVAQNPSRFDETKLRWLNGVWIRHLDTSDLSSRLSVFTGRSDLDLDAAAAASQEKLHTLADFWPLVGPLYDGVVDDERARAKVFADASAATGLAAAREALAVVTPWSAEAIDVALHELLEQLDVKPNKLFQPLRVALTGTTISPGIAETVVLLDRAEVLRRIDSALATLAGQAQSPSTFSLDELRVALEAGIGTEAAARVQRIADAEPIIRTDEELDAELRAVADDTLDVSTRGLFD